MSSGKRGFRGQADDGELFLECKASFLSVYDEITDKIDSKKDLITVLQQSGRNPIRRNVDNYWTRSTDELSFNDFVDICRKEPVTTTDDLMKAFRKIDINGDGYISLDELYKIMNQKGESMSRDEVRRMIDDVDDNKDGRLDYKESGWEEDVDYEEFSNMIMKTTNECKKMSLKAMERKERRKKRSDRRNSGTNGIGNAKKAESPKRVKSPEPKPKSEIPKSEPKPETPKTGTKTPRDTTDVEEDIDDDMDIMSTGRSTPHIDLRASLHSQSPTLTKETKYKETPEKDEVVANVYEKESKGSKLKEDEMPSPAKAGQDENGYSSPSELRGDKDLTPVPSPRKRVVEDEYPKPSPRPRKTDIKGKSQTTKTEKLPDARTLTHWSHSTSKGSFFYEDNEIVTHVYSLKLSVDSSVYLKAHPIQGPTCLSLKGDEPVDTALFVLDSRGRVVTFSEQRDVQGAYGVKCELSAGEYQVLPYTTGCRFKQHTDEQHTREAKLVKKDKDDKILITSAFKKALEDIFDLCDLDDNGTMSKDEFNWFNLRTSGEELAEDEWEVVEERTVLENGEITKKGFIELNEMEAEDSKGEVDDLWITLTSMGLNKALIMDEACPYRVDVYVEKSGRQSPKLRCIGIESLENKEYVTEICNSIAEKSTSDPVKVQGMKDLCYHTYKNDHRATIMIDNKSRSPVNVEIDCKGSRNVVSNRDRLSHTVEVEPQSVAIAHHLLPRSETSDWSITCTEAIHN